MPRLMRRVGDPKIAHNLFEAPTVLIVCHKAASLIREQVFAIWVIVILYQLTDQWMHRTLRSIPASVLMPPLILQRTRSTFTVSISNTSEGRKPVYMENRIMSVTPKLRIFHRALHFAIFERYTLSLVTFACFLNK